MIDFLAIVPPHDLRAELVLAGCAFVRPAVLDVIENVRPEHFYNATFAAVYRACRDIWERGGRPTVPGVAMVLSHRGSLDDLQYDQASGRQAIVRIERDVPTATLAVDSAEKVRRAAALRALSEAGLRLASDARRGEAEDVGVLVAEHLAAVDEATAEPEIDATTAMDRSLAWIAAVRAEQETPGARQGPATGIGGLDGIMRRGLQPGSLIIICGRPGAGKSSLADQIAAQVAGTRKAVAYFSREMPCDEMQGRAVARATGIASMDLYRAEYADAVIAASRKLSGLPYFVDDRRARLDAIVACMRRLVRREKIVLAVIDHCGLLRHGDKKWTTEQRISDIAITAKNTATHLGIALILICQLNRETEGRVGLERRPRLADLRSSGELEQSADVVLSLWRPTPDCDLIEASILKHRGGPCGTFYLDFEGARFRFTDPVDGDAAEEEFIRRAKGKGAEKLKPTPKKDKT